MSGESPAWSSDWNVGLRVWVERAGRAVLGKGRLELLEGIGRHGSISAAARQLGMSYRRAWLLVQDINQAAGVPLVEAATGGPHGGGARLTSQGHAAVTVFRDLQQQLHQAAAALLPRLIQAPGTPAVHVAAASTLEEVLGQLLADYALRRPAVRVRAVFGASDELADHLLAGAPADLFLAADPRQLDRLEAAGLVQPGSRAALAENCLVAVGPEGRPAAVRKPTDLVRPDAGRLALAAPGCPLGGYARAYLEGLGLYEAVAAHALWVDNARSVVAAVRAGRVEVGLAYGSDAAHAEGCRVLFRARRGPTAILHAGAVVRRGQQPEQAQDLLDFLTSPAAARRFRRCGFRPVRDPAA